MTGNPVQITGIVSPVSLQEQCLSVCANSLLKLPPMKKEKLGIVHQYLELASPLVTKISKKCHYQFYGNRTLLFIPFLLRKELILTDQNINEVTLWINSFTSTEQRAMIKLHKLIVNAPKAENYFKILPFISKVSDILKLELGSWTTDDVLAAISMHCKKLEVFDARLDAESVVTDVGLGFLSQCKSLRMVLFSNIPDEYDYEDKFKFTGKGIALLMLSLRNLERIECPEYLLRDALQYIYQMNFQNPVLTLKSLFVAYPDVPAQTISLLPYLCPHLETLSVYVPNESEAIIGTSIKRLLSLKKLKLKFEVSCSVVALNMSDYKSQLEFLIIDAQFLHEGNVYELDRTFSKLKTLVLTVHSYGFMVRPSKKRESVSFNIFSQLHTVQFNQRVSSKLFKLICVHAKKLRALFCQDSTIYEIENAIDYVVSNGGWSDLEVLALPQSYSFSCNFLFRQLSKLVSLKVVAVKFINNEEKQQFISLVIQSSLNFQLCHTHQLVQPSDELTDV